MNSRLFDSRRIAEGYLKRPWLHKSVVEQIKRDCDIVQPFRNWVDRDKFLKNMSRVMEPGGLFIIYDFTMAEFIDFMMIQSNVNAKIENGEMTECEVRAWMSESLSDIFESQTRTLGFAGYNWYLKKSGIC